MTSRGYLQWELVGVGSDPVPASEYDVEQVAKEFSTQGVQMNDAASLLRRLSGLSGWTGEAAKEFIDKADEAEGDLDKAAEKYVDAGKALSTFALHVGTARTETAAAVADAVEAEAQRKSNSASLLEGVDEPTDEQKTADDDRDQRLTDAGTAMTAARTRLVKAIEALDTAANTAATAIRAASEQFKDSTMDDVKGFVKSALKVIVDALNVLAIILAVIIIVLLIIGTGGAFLAFLITAAFVVGAAIFALTAVQMAMGDADWKDLAWASLGLIGGGVMSKGLKGAVKIVGLTRAAQVTRITAEAKDGLSVWVKFAKNVPIDRIKLWANGVETRAVNEAVSAFTGPLDSLASTNRLVRGLQLDDLSTTVRQISALKNMDLPLDLLKDLSKAQGLTGLAGLGALGQFVAQGHDVGQVMESLNNTIDNIGDGLDFIGGAGEPINVHVSGAGR